MKKIMKTVCCFLTVIMIFYTIPYLSVSSAEDTRSGGSAVLYDKAFMGVGFDVILIG
jgi:hypothetical protein